MKEAMKTGSEHTQGELLKAAICYAHFAILKGNWRDWARETPQHYQQLRLWPWEIKCWKPSRGNSLEDYISDLTKAHELIAAEIDRLKRLEEER